MRVLSVCSGIEAASVAWHPLGWEFAAFAEIEPFPSAVLAHHYPSVPNLGDMTKFQEWPDLGAIDLLCGGTPCQSFSVAGLRKGLDDPRGDLMLTFGAIAAKHRPQWLVWENVPGVLSSNGGRDFGAFLGLLGLIGYGFAYRVLDAQYFGLAQRRKRVFVVGCLGDWRRAAAVLFERNSMSGHPAPSRGKGKAAPTIPSRSTAGGGLGTDFDCDGGLIAAPHADISPALKARDCKGVSSDGDGDGAILVPMLAHALTGEGFDASEDGSGRGTPLVPVGYDQFNDAGNRMPSALVPHPYTLAIRGRGDSHDLEYRQDGTANALLTPNGGRAGIGVGAVAFAIQAGAMRENPASGPDGVGVQTGQAYTLEARSEVQAIAFSAKDYGADAQIDLAPTLRAGGHDKSHANAGVMPAIAFGSQMSTPHWQHDQCDTLQAKNPKGVVQGMQVRRLTPRECCRLQGFPDDYLDITYRGKPAADGPKYKALGNSWAVPVVAWIGRRIEAVAAIAMEQAA